MATIERWLRVIRLPQDLVVVNLLGQKPEMGSSVSDEIRIEIDMDRPVGQRVREYVT